MKNPARTFLALNLALACAPMFQAGAAVSNQDSDDAGALREKLLFQQKAIQELTQSLANANNEAEGYKREAADLRMKIETLGVIVDDKNGNKLQEKLLAAVRDLRLSQRSEQETRERLVQLSEAVIAILKSSNGIDPQMRSAVEGELRTTGEMLGVASANAVTARAEPASLTEGMVINVKEDLALVVANIGKKQDVKLGMPFKVMRNDEQIGEVRVVDVRDRICGAIVCNMVSEKQKIEVGDRLKVEARQ